MKSQRRQVLHQSSVFRPGLERLENRDCPSCTVFQREQTLFILGDKSANIIAITDTHEGDISVTCDVADSHRFTGVNRIDVRTLGGDDEINATFQNAANPAFEFHAELGAGNDRASISGFDPQPDPPRWAAGFYIRAGAGDDEVQFDLGGSEINGQFVVSAYGGLGNDRLSFGGIIPCVLPESELRTGLDGGAGDDLIEVSLTNAEFEGRFDLAVGGGRGNDRLLLDAADPCWLPGSETRFAFVGGAGGDVIEMSFSGLEVEGGQFALDAAGGAGDDRMMLAAVEPCWLPESQARLSLLGNAGDDLIEISLTNLEIGGRFDLSALGGLGNDTLDSSIIPCVLPAGRASFLFDGNTGADRVAVRFEADEDSRGALNIHVLGGLGDDDLTLALLGVDELALLTALLDGGSEFDIARVTRNVRVANCEAVSFLDDPR